jgi:hypothetical protein
MLWQRILVGIAMSVFMSGMFSIVVYQDLVRRYGRKMYEQDLGRGHSLQHYSLDQEGVKRARRNTLIFFIVCAALIFACTWSTLGQVIADSI